MLLGIRQIQHASIWTTTLIIFIMMLTFLNLVVVSGILVGLLEGSFRANAEQHTGDVFLSTLDGEEYIEQSTSILETLALLPGVKDFSPRYTTGATIEANYRTRRDPQEVRDTFATRIVGISPENEDRVTHLSDFIIEGEFLAAGDEGYILLGANMLEQYAPDFGDALDTLANVSPGTRVRLSIGGAAESGTRGMAGRQGDRMKEYIVKGIIKSKVDDTSFRAFILDNEFRLFAGRNNLNVNEVAIVVDDKSNPVYVKQAILDSGIGRYARVRLAREALPQALEDIITTFEILGNAISSIGLLVSSVTMFIVVFVNAITRRKFIGILKGIGIYPFAIEFSYVFQAFVYALVGSLLAMLIIYGLLVPFFATHPIDFPFSDGILVAPLGGTLIRLFILMIATIVAGYIPAWMIIKKNTLDSILGRS
jgi:putative ABC transport system permease protein